MKHKMFIICQAIFVVATLAAILVFYPRASLDLIGNKASFRSLNANVIIISSNPDFSNPRYVDINDSASFNLKPGTYYWKASNGVIEGLSKKFRIDSDIGLKIVEKDNEHELKNVGDVRVNVTKTKNGTFVGYIVLEPEESEEIENEEDKAYTGRQDDEV